MLKEKLVRCSTSSNKRKQLSKIELELIRDIEREKVEYYYKGRFRINVLIFKVLIP